MWSGAFQDGKLSSALDDLRKAEEEWDAMLKRKDEVSKIRRHCRIVFAYLEMFYILILPYSP